MFSSSNEYKAARNPSIKSSMLEQLIRSTATALNASPEEYRRDNFKQLLSSIVKWLSGESLIVPPEHLRLSITSFEDEVTGSIQYLSLSMPENFHAQCGTSLASMKLVVPGLFVDDPRITNQIVLNTNVLLSRCIPVWRLIIAPPSVDQAAEQSDSEFSSPFDFGRGNVVMRC